MRSIYPWLFKRAILPAADVMVGTRYHAHLRQFERLQTASRAELVAWQRDRLGELIRHVYARVPFYRDHMRERGLTPADIREPGDLRHLPVLTKADIKAHYERFKADNFQEYKCMLTGTGGSTGAPLKYHLPMDAYSAGWARKLLMLKEFGFRLGEPYLALGSSRIVPDARPSRGQRIFHRLLRVRPLNAVNMDAEKCEAALELIRRDRLRMAYGYASALYLLARHVLDHRREARLDLCVTTSDKLTPAYEAVIREAFQCEVVDEYGARDAGIYAYRCGQGRFHMIESCLFHLTDVGPDGRGSLVATNLLNRAMPFINYNIEDIITPHDEPCGCGRPTFCFSDIVGRSSEVMRLKNGASITGPAFCTLFQKLPVRMYQFAPVDGETIEVRLERDEGYGEDTEAAIRRAIANHVGGHVMGRNYKDKFRKAVYNFISNSVSFNPYDTSEQNLQAITRALQTNRFELIRGYPQFLFSLARRLKDQGLSFQVRAVTTTAEPLMPEQRKLFAEVFHAESFDQYGCGEINGISYECPTHSGMHIMEERVIVEVNEKNQLIVTDLDNFAMPFIRYWNADEALISDEPCPCGRKSRLIKQVMGRTCDYVCGLNGQILHWAYFWHLFFDSQVARKYDLRKFQVVQEAPDAILIRLVCGKLPEDEERLLVENMRSRLGPVKAHYVYEADIENSASGKYRPVVNNLLVKTGGASGPAGTTP